MDKHFYGQSKWESKRKAILRRDNYQCRMCRRFGKRTAAKIVHHAIPTEEHPELRLTDWNLVSLCYSCHEKMHDRDTGLLTEEGENLKRRILRDARVQGWIPN